MQEKICERDVEQFFVREIKKAGGMTYKFVSPSNAGVPDRIVLYRGKAIFVELKRPNQTMRPLQRAVAAKFKQQGFDVFVLDSKEAVREFVRNEVRR
nr:MAG TPA: Nuclease [Caudoviricetes sp.]